MERNAKWAPNSFRMKKIRSMKLCSVCSTTVELMPWTKVAAHLKVSTYLVPRWSSRRSNVIKQSKTTATPQTCKSQALNAWGSCTPTSYGCMPQRNPSPATRESKRRQRSRLEKNCILDNKKSLLLRNKLQLLQRIFQQSQLLRWCKKARRGLFHRYLLPPKWRPKRSGQGAIRQMISSLRARYRMRWFTPIAFSHPSCQAMKTSNCANLQSSISHLREPHQTC